MLIQLSISNFLSFYDETSFDMTPTGNQCHGDHIIEDTEGQSVRAVSLSAIYGPNASGKSNFIRAVEFLRDFVVFGDTIRQHKEVDIPVTAFLLDKKSQDSPSRFEVLFKTEGVAYVYGFVVSRERVVEEWLFAHYSSRESRVFERKWNEHKNKYDFVFGSKLRSLDSKNLSEWMPEKLLLITYAHQKKVCEKILSPVYRWFEEIIIIHNLAKYANMPFELNENEDFARFISKLLSHIDTGIQEVTVQKEELTEEILRQQPLFIQFALKIKQMTEDKTKPYRLTILTRHKKTDGGEISFPLFMESDGTERILQLLPVLYCLYNAQKSDLGKSPASYRICFIDELDNSLHSSLSRWFIEQFLSHCSKNNGQLIFTTHDTNLIDSKLFRKDEIWFMEKEDNGSSHFTRLSDYKTSDGLNWENGYINGRFGAIPVISPIRDF